MSCELLVTPKITIKLDVDEPPRHDERRNEVRWMAFDAIKDMDPEKLKALVVEGLTDAYGYPYDYAEFC